MRIHLLGTGGFSRDRNDACIVVEHGGAATILDCGEPCAASLRRMGKSVDDVPSRVRRIFVSHMHFDHVTGLPMLLVQTTRARQQVKETGGESGIDLHVPACANPRILETIDILNMAGQANHLIKDSVKLHSLSHGAMFEDEGLTVTALRNVAADSIESYAFLIEDGQTRVLYSGDLKGTLAPLDAYLDGLDYLILETAHIEPCTSAAELVGKRVESIIFSHVNKQLEGHEQRILDDARAHLPHTPLWVAADGMVLEPNAQVTSGRRGAD